MSDPCLEDLKDASFDGAPFWVDTDAGTYGRRVITHEYPMRDDPFYEDLGEAAQHFKVKGYVYGPSAISQKDALIAAARKRGAADLQLPAEQSFQARLISLVVNRSKDKLGWFDLDFEFKKDDGGNADGPEVSSVFELLLSSSLGSVIGPLSGFLASAIDISSLLPLTTGLSSLSGITGVLGLTDILSGGLSLSSLLPIAGGLSITNVLPFVVDNFIGRVQVLASALESAVSIFPLVEGIAAQVNSAIVTVLADPLAAVEGIVQAVFIDPSTSTAATGVAPLVVSGPTAVAVSGASFVQPLAFVLGAIASNAKPADAQAMLLPFTVFSVAESAPASMAPSDIADSANALAFCTVVRTMALIAYSQAVAIEPPTTRVASIQMRADLAEKFNGQIINLGSNFDAILVVEEARDTIVKALTSVIVNLAPIITVESSASMPSLYWAWRLYADPARADDLVSRNSVPNPCFMPTRFEALAT